MSKESSFWKWLRELRLPGRFSRIETEVTLGIPDVYYVLDTVAIRSGWIELKSLRAPKRKTARPLKRRGLRPEQTEWISEHVRLGITVWIFVKLGRVVYAFPGQDAWRLNNLTFEQIQRKAFYKIPIGRSKSWTRSEFLRLLS